MVSENRILVSQAARLDNNRLYGYNFYEETLGFGSIEEILPAGSNRIASRLTLADQGEQVIETSKVLLFAPRPIKARHLISEIINQALEAGTVSLR